MQSFQFEQQASSSQQHLIASFPFYFKNNGTNSLLKIFVSIVWGGRWASNGYHPRKCNWQIQAEVGFIHFALMVEGMKSLFPALQHIA